MKKIGLMCLCLFVTACRGTRSISASHSQSEVIESVTIRADTVHGTKAYTDSMERVMQRYDSLITERIRNDSTRLVSRQKDSTSVRDSVYVTERADGTREIYRERETIRNIYTHDTIYNNVSLLDYDHRFSLARDSLNRYRSLVDSLSLIAMRHDSLDRQTDHNEQTIKEHKDSLMDRLSKVFTVLAMILAIFLVCIALRGLAYKNK